MKIKLLILSLFVYHIGYAQTKNIENRPLEKHTYQEMEQNFYSVGAGNLNSTRYIATYYLKKARSEKNEAQIAEAYVMLHFDQPLPVALKYLDSLQTITKKSKENIYPARTYLLRGNLYFRSENLQSALNNYLLGLKYAKEKQNKRQIALANIGIAYLNNYIGKHAETAKTLRYYAYKADYMNDDERTRLKLNLADAYIEINKMDSAYILIQEGLRTSEKNKDVFSHYENLGLMGFYHLKQEKYKAAIENLIPCEKFYFEKNNLSKRGQHYTLLNLGKSYAGLQDKEKAVACFTKIDSLVLKTDYFYPELREVYTYLLNYYKEHHDKEKQLYYVERFLQVDNILDTRFRYISRELPRRYDAPMLQQEKESITSELEKRKTLFYIVLSCLLISHLLFINFYFKYKRSERKHKMIAQDLLQSVNAKNDHQYEIKEEAVSQQIPVHISDDKTSKVISEDIVHTILKELEIFENKDQFLHKGITLGSLAKKIKTNSKYLSEIINTYKGKNFATYLNDLRIDYAIRRLANDKKFRSYKLTFIAEELGYNNEQAFTLAFKKRTGTPLSVYLKEIENMESI